MTPVGSIISRVSHDTLVQRFEISEFEDGNVHDFLIAVAKRRGKLKKGGVPDVDAAARSVLMDWNTGKIPYCTAPPVSEEMETGDAGPMESELVGELSKEFSIDALMEKKDLEQCGAMTDVVMMEAQENDDDDDDDDEMDDEDGDDDEEEDDDEDME